MENLDQYKRMIDESLWCIIVLLFWLIKFQKLKFFVIMTQSQLLNHGEEQKNGEGMRKRLKISVAHFDNSALIKTYSKTLIGRCMNPEEQEMKALFTNLPKIRKLEDRVTGSDLSFGKFRFDFKMEEELEEVLKQQPFHFDYWMLSLARWQPKQSRSFPSEIMFWVRVIGIPLEFRTVPTFDSIGGALGRVVAVDVTLNRVQVVVDAFKELCFETTVDFKGGEFYDGEEAAVSLRYEKLFGYCKLCEILCHKEELCPLEEKNIKSSPARRRETREGTVDGLMVRSMRSELVVTRVLSLVDTRVNSTKGEIVENAMGRARVKWLIQQTQSGSRQMSGDLGSLQLIMGTEVMARARGTKIRGEMMEEMELQVGELVIRSHVLNPLQNNQRMINVRGFQVRKHEKKERLRAMEMMLRYYRLRGFNLS
uniref:DUF4283 domain-containing protein n=1 Tax=Brassica oleracea var. oleracea TaxID=109376 RepID=A0A0D3EDS6_BRAOL